MELDSAERQILTALQLNGRLSNVDLAAQIGLSETPTLRRVKQLEDKQLIRGYAAVVDQRLLGLEVSAYVQVSMKGQTDKTTAAFHERVLAEPHIIECHAMSGAYDYLMKVVARNIDHFSHLCMQQLLKFPGVAHIESSFSLLELKHSRVLPAKEDTQ